MVPLSSQTIEFNNSTMILWQRVQSHYPLTVPQHL
jgi:hypothetical protein